MIRVTDFRNVKEIYTGQEIINEYEKAKRTPYEEVIEDLHLKYFANAVTLKDGKYHAIVRGSSIGTSPRTLIQKDAKYLKTSNGLELVPEESIGSCYIKITTEE